MDIPPPPTSPEELLRAENAELRARLEKAEAALRVSRSGEVEAVAVETEEGPQIFSHAAAEAASNRFRGEILAQVSDAVGMIDNDERIIFLNPAIERLYRVQPGEMLGRKLGELYQRRWLKPGDEAAANAILRENGKASWELIHITRDGRELQVQSSVCLMRDAEGNVTGIIAAIRDITERKLAEEQLRASEERLALGTEVADLGLAEVDYTTGLHHLTARAARLFGLGAAAVALPRAEVHATFHPEDRPELERRIAQCLDPAGSGWFAMDHRVVWPGGEVRWLAVRKQVFFTGKGPARRPARAVLAAQDVTAEKTAAEALRESEERMRALTLAMPQLVWTCSREGDCIFQSPQWEAVTGQTAAASLGYGWLEMIHPGDRERTADVWKAAVDGWRTYEADYRLRGKDGTYRWFLARAEPLSDPSGEPRYWIGTSTDIHDAKQTAEKLRRAAEEVSRASRAKDDFLAALSHELHTPLTPVLMTATSLESDATLPLELRDQLGMMRRNVELQARLIDDLLDITRISRGKLILAPIAADLHQLLEHTAEIVRSDELGKQVRIVFSLGAERHHALADPARLQQVFWNLIKNALKFTPTGGSIAVRTRNDPEGWIVVSVEDSGVGISAEALPHIFTAFEQGDVAGQHRYGGLGLGLAISQAIVDAHGGTIQADSKGAGLGATFTVILASIEAPAAAPATTPASAPAPALRLLVVEDHEATRIVLARLLTRSGHQVTTAGSIQDALLAFAADRFDAVISDLGLPDGSGLDLMREIQRMRPVPAIALSGYGMEDDLRQTKEAGFFAHLVKPVNLDQLKQLLTQLTTRG